MERTDMVTPVKLQVNGDDIAIATPSGGIIFNPFHKEFMSRIGHATFSPGVFAFHASPVTRDESSKTTPNRLSGQFILSPDTQGLLFPAEIDENPVFQLKLQEKLDTQCDDDVQDTIHSFFKSHLIAPSPDTLGPPTCHNSRPLLPRTSSIIPTATPRVKRTHSCNANLNPLVFTHAAVQTALSIPPAFDLEALIRHAIDSHSNSTNHDTEQSSNGDRCASTDAPRFDACAVQRPTECDTNQHCYLCVSNHRSNHQYTRRSLFSESSSIHDESCIRIDVPSSGHQTLMPKNSSFIQPLHSTHLSSSMHTANDSMSDDSAEFCSLLPRDTKDSYLIEPDRLSCSPVLTDRPVIRFTSAEALPTTPVHSKPQQPSNAVDSSSGSGKHSSRIVRRRMSLQSPYMFRDKWGFDSPNLSPILPASPILRNDQLNVDCTMHTPTSRVLASPVTGSSKPASPTIPVHPCSDEPSLMND